MPLSELSTGAADALIGQYGPVMRLTSGRVAAGAGMVAGLALAALAWTGALVTWRYRPDGGGSESGLPPAAEWSRRLVHWHAVSLYVAVVALALWCGLTIARLTLKSRRSAVVMGSTLGAEILVAVSAVAWHRVRWDQLGLWAVTVGESVNGLWYAAFSDDVRFVFVGGSGELAPSDLAPWVVAYLVAPLAALVVFAAGWAAARPSGSPRRTIVAADP